MVIADPPLELVRREPRSQQAAVVEAIRRLVVLGLVAEGERLPPERELAPMLGVARRTLRSAIAQLAVEGLVETRLGRNGGTVVRPLPVAERGRSCDTEAMLRDVERAYEARHVLEPALAHAAAQRAGSDAVAEILALAHAEFATAVEFRKLDSRFHLLVARSGDNPVLTEALERARAAFFVWADALWMPFEPIGREELVSRRHHIAVAEAIAARAPRAAAAAMRRHLTWSASTFTQRLPSAAARAAPRPAD